MTTQARPAAQTVRADATEQVNYAALATWKANLKMEKIGMKTRGGALRPRMAERLGLKPRDSHDVYIARCEELMAQILAEKGIYKVTRSITVTVHDNGWFASLEGKPCALEHLDAQVVQLCREKVREVCKEKGWQDLSEL